MRSRSALFSISLTGVNFVAPTIVRSAICWTLSSLLLLAFEAMVKDFVAYFAGTLRGMFVSAP